MSPQQSIFDRSGTRDQRIQGISGWCTRRRQRNHYRRSCLLHCTVGRAARQHQLVAMLGAQCARATCLPTALIVSLQGPLSVVLYEQRMQCCQNQLSQHSQSSRMVTIMCAYDNACEHVRMPIKPICVHAAHRCHWRGSCSTAGTVAMLCCDIMSQHQTADDQLCRIMADKRSAAGVMLCYAACVCSCRMASPFMTQGSGVT